MPKKKTWKIIDRGKVPVLAQTIEYHCECGVDAMLPVMGSAIAQVNEMLVFDGSSFSCPAKIQCRSCGRVLESGGRDVR